MTYYERNLPHWHPENAAIFLTWRLHGTWAKFVKATQAGMPVPRDFADFDRTMDFATSGPKWLGEPAIAQCVVDAFRFGERHLKLYTLVAFCVMPNHVHIVVEPLAPLPKITKSIKGFTARTANQILGRTGERFWQDDSYDRWIRNADQRGSIVEYIENNPVSAGLIEAAEQWPWSSASHAITVQLPAAL
ncbi:conserved hypothetical protein [Candidatus Sulfopaludibacter sp. SbA4]|nr:conserved hypothetical protein [Candidatus Sulfopaludibacter sp. SbA4]